MFRDFPAPDGAAIAPEHGDSTDASPPRVTIVIPFKWGWIKPDAVLRLVANCILLRRLRPLAQVAVADGSFWKFPTRILAWLLKFQHLSVDSPRYYSPAQVKNAATRQITHTQYLLFLDVDVILTHAAWSSLQAAIRTGVQFTWLPVVFLDRSQGTLQMIRQVLPKATPPNTAARVQIGYSTGIHLFDRRFFTELAGYKEALHGYGCEDIEMIHRATGTLSQRPLFDAEAEYYDDVRSHDAQSLAGFRKLFFEMRRDVPLDAMPIHYWHKRKNKSDYMLQRKTNDRIMHQMMIEFDARRLAPTASGMSSSNSTQSDLLAS